MVSLRRDHLIELADGRERAAQMLLNAGHFSDAYYLAGYVAELTLKAIIARQFDADAIPDRKLVERIHTHKIEELIAVSGLKQEALDLRRQDEKFDWAYPIVCDWSEASRYDIILPTSAGDLLRALFDSTGIMPWLRSKL